MSRLEFEATAAEAYERIADARVLDTIDAVLDGLEKDPGQDWLRRHRWSDPPLWGVTVPGHIEDHLVLWAPETRNGETFAVVYYIGPDASGTARLPRTRAHGTVLRSLVVPPFVPYPIRHQPKRPFT